MSVAEAQARISSREFAEWQAYDQVDPFGEWRSDFRAGVIASATVNLWRRRGETTSPADFMPDFVEGVRRAIDQDRVSAADRAADRAFAESMGARRVSK